MSTSLNYDVVGGSKFVLFNLQDFEHVPLLVFDIEEMFGEETSAGHDKIAEICELYFNFELEIIAKSLYIRCGRERNEEFTVEFIEDNLKVTGLRRSRFNNSKYLSRDYDTELEDLAAAIDAIGENLMGVNEFIDKVKARKKNVSDNIQ